MASLNQLLTAFGSEDQQVREAASRLLLREFKQKPSDLPINVVAFIANRLNDGSSQVKENVAEFVYLYSKSGRELGQAWLNMVSHLANNNQKVRQFVNASFEYLGNSETTMKSILDNPRLPGNIKEPAAQVLTHYYIKKKYFSSLMELLKKESVVVSGAFKGINFDRRLGTLQKQDFEFLMPSMRDAQVRLTTRPMQRFKELPRRDIRDRRPNARA